MRDGNIDLVSVEPRAKILVIQGTARLSAALQELKPRIVAVESMTRAAQDLAAGRLKPDVILVQSDIASLDALTAFQRISEANLTGAPIIFLGTAADRKKLLEVMWLGGLFDFVTEPFDVQDLRQRVQHAIEQHRKNMRTRRRAKQVLAATPSLQFAAAHERQVLPSKGLRPMSRQRLRTLL